MRKKTVFVVLFKLLFHFRITTCYKRFTYISFRTTKEGFRRKSIEFCKSVSSWFANNKGADQPAHLRRLVSAFVIHLEIILATTEIQFSN